MDDSASKKKSAGPGPLALALFAVPLALIAFVVFFGSGSDGTCTINRPPCGSLGIDGEWVAVIAVPLASLGFMVWAIRSATGGPERRRALAAGTEPATGRLLSINSTGTSINDAPQLLLEFELADKRVVTDRVVVPLYLMAQLRPGDEVPLLLAVDGDHFNLDKEAMSRVRV